MGGLPIGSRNRFGAGFWSEARFSPDPLRGRISPRRDHRNGAGRGEKINRRRLGFRARTGGPHERAIRTIGVHARAAAEPATACPTSRRRRCAPGSKKAASRSGWSASRQAQLPACNDPKLPPPAIASRAWKGIVPPRRRGGGDHRGSMHVVPGGVLVRMQEHRAATQFELNENAIATR